MGLVKSRQELPSILPENSIAVELGVAEAVFSEELLQSENIAKLYSIDAWACDRGHDDKEYQRAVTRLKPYGKRSEIVRAFFKDAVGSFVDEIFDLVYIDGYAHTGQEQGQTIRDWWPKVRSGGVFAGHDYSEKWPLVVSEVNKFAAKECLNVHVIPKEPGTYKFPSWYVLKP